MTLNITKPKPDSVSHGQEIKLKATGHARRRLEWTVLDLRGRPVGELTDPTAATTAWRPTDDVPPGKYTAKLVARTTAGRTEETTETIEVEEHPFAVGHTVPVRVTDTVGISLERAVVPCTSDIALWEAIRGSTDAIAFPNYQEFMQWLFCDGPPPSAFVCDPKPDATTQAPIPYPDMKAYKLLKAATEAFLECTCGVVCHDAFPSELLTRATARNGASSGSSVAEMWSSYLLSYGKGEFIPYLERIREKLGDVPLLARQDDSGLCDAIMREKFACPCLLELIWSYWHEEGMLAQTLGALSMRFQNRRGPAERDPLAALAIDPLRPLGNLLWGYIQDEQHRLTIARRAYEYDHEYGITLVGEAVPRIRSAESRSAFLGAFHALLHRTAIFYQQDDDTTVIADAFPLLNALREVHLLLAEGAHNQYGDLPWAARVEMLIQQWLLSRAEFREFLPTRTMVVYAEPWMERVDAMKRLQGWTNTSVRFFHDLARFGEQLLLSVRFGDWSNVVDPAQAGNWARFWRQAVQWYIHAYQAVTGVDLSADIIDTRQAEQARERALQPALHLQRRLLEQHNRGALGTGRGAAQRAGS